MSVSSVRKRSVGVTELRSEYLQIRMLPSVKRRLEALSEGTGYTMSSLVEWAILRMDVSDFPESGL